MKEFPELQTVPQQPSEHSIGEVPDHVWTYAVAWAIGIAIILGLAWLSGCSGAASGPLMNVPGSIMPYPGGSIMPGSPGGIDTPPSGTGGGGSNGAVSLDSEESAFLQLINAYRTQNGLTALTASVTLTQASQWMSGDMAAKNYFDHTDSLGRDPFTRMADFGYSGATSSGENIAAGNATAQATFDQWKSSPGHNANMLGSSYRAIGIGRGQGSNSTYGWYWTTDFGSAVDQALAQVGPIH